MASGRFVAPVSGGPRLTATRTGDDNYLGRIAKYVPTEVVAAYLFLNGLIVSASNGNQVPGDPVWWNLAAFLVGWVVVPLYLWRQAPPGQPKVMQIAISTTAFPIWAYAIGAALFEPVANAFVASFALAVFSLVSGLFVPKEDEP